MPSFTNDDAWYVDGPIPSRQIPGIGVDEADGDGPSELAQGNPAAKISQSSMPLLLKALPHEVG